MISQRHLFLHSPPSPPTDGTGRKGILSQLDKFCSRTKERKLQMYFPILAMSRDFFEKKSFAIALRIMRVARMVASRKGSQHRSEPGSLKQDNEEEVATG